VDLHLQGLADSMRREADRLLPILAQDCGLEGELEQLRDQADPDGVIRFPGLLDHEKAE